MKSPFEDQIGGTWYSKLPIQPIDFITKNELDWFQGNIIKYTIRHKLKHGSDDVKKIIHYAQMLLNNTYGIQSEIIYRE